MLSGSTTELPCLRLSLSSIERRRAEAPRAHAEGAQVILDRVFDEGAQSGLMELNRLTAAAALCGSWQPPTIRKAACTHVIKPSALSRISSPLYRWSSRLQPIFPLGSHQVIWSTKRRGSRPHSVTQRTAMQTRIDHLFRNSSPLFKLAGKQAGCWSKH